MATFTLDIPDELLPAIVAEFSIVTAAGATSAATPEEYFAASVIEILRQRAEDYQVGPYYVGPVSPRFAADGMPFGFVAAEVGEQQQPVDGQVNTQEELIS